MIKVEGKYFLVNEGVVVTPYIEFQQFDECIKWANDNLAVGQFAQWIYISHCTKVVEDEQS